VIFLLLPKVWGDIFSFLFIIFLLVFIG